MNRGIIGAVMCTFLCSIGVAFGQTGTPIGIRWTPTPAQQATLDKAYQLAIDARTALESGQIATAEADAHQSISANPDWSILAYQVLASAYAEEGKTQDALSAFARSGRNPEYQLPYALLLLKTGQWAKAVNIYNNVLPHVGSTLMDGHVLLSDDGDYSPESPAPNELETDIHIALGFTGVDDYGVAGPSSRGKALAEYQEAVKLTPDSPLANLAYARGLKEVGKAADAKAAFQNVISKYSGDIKIAAEKETGAYYTTPEFRAEAEAAAKAGQPAP